MAAFFPANQKFFKAFFALIGWVKAGPPKRPLLLWTCKQAFSVFSKDTATRYRIGSRTNLSIASPPSPN